ncbi:MAG: GNAT family N-acetyltransferase, partial [Spirochaetota bacterium]
SRPIGMVSLKAYDLVTRRDLSPWLSALYVDVKFRNRGIGRLLVKTAIQTALNRGYPLLFLFTDRDNTDELVRFYSRLGWTYHDDARDIRSFQVKIMKYLLQSPPAAPMCND